MNAVISTADRLSSAIVSSLQSCAAVPMQPASLDIWEKKYRLTDRNGTPVDEKIDDTYQRVAQALASVESPKYQVYWYEQFLWAMRHGAIPAGRITSNAGAEAYKPKTSTINCTVSGTIEDSMVGILDKLHDAGLTLKAGCGIGYCYSTIRPQGSFVVGAGAGTSGPIPFMQAFDKVCATVASAGNRRGAQMGTFDIGHPDAVAFIQAKREDGNLRNFNLSLLITDEFIQAVKENTTWKFAFPVMAAEKGDLDIDNPDQVIWRDWEWIDEGYTVRVDGKVACKVYGTMPAAELWDLIMQSTYDFAEPGFILIDRVNQMNNLWFCENIRATNP